MELVRSYRSTNFGLPRNRGGSAPASLFSGPAQRSLTLRPARSPGRLCDPLHQRLQQSRCLHCCSDCYRVERTSSRAGFLPLWTSAFRQLHTQPKTFAAWLRPLYRQYWVVYLKPPFGGPEYVLQYLGRYTHRVAISNHRLVSFTDGQVTFHWRDSADHNKQKLLPLSVNEFLCRFLLHILPQGFVRIRHFGLLANRRRTTLLPLCFQLLSSGPQPQAEHHASSTEDAPALYRCPKCGGPMKVIERLTAAEIQLRSPPMVTAAA